MMQCPWRSEREVDSLMELELPTVQSQHVGTENQTQSSARTASALTSEPSLQLLMNSTFW